jgi:uncharacterized protein
MIAEPHYGAYLVLLAFFLANVYFYIRLVWSLKPSPPILWLSGLVLCLLFLCLPVGKYLGRFDYNFFDYLLTLISSVWLGFTIFFATCAGIYDLFRLIWKRSPYGKKFLFSERLSFGPFLMTSFLLLVIFLGGCALREAKQIVISHIEIPLRNLPRELDGMTITQISDVHYGMLTENGRLSEIVQIVNDTHPDIVVLTGDLVDEKIAHMEQMTGPLSQLHSRLGKFAVLGNHEYYAGAGRVAKILGDANIHLLRNDFENLPGGLQILGVDDPTGFKRMNEPKPDFDGLISRLDPQKPSILLYHRPRGFEEAAQAKVGLQLSGHTHGAQIFPIRPLAEIWFPYVRGLHQIGESFLYVSRGVGTGGPPMRLGSPPEIVHIRLRSQS